MCKYSILLNQMQRTSSSSSKQCPSNSNSSSKFRICSSKYTRHNTWLLKCNIMHNNKHRCNSSNLDRILLEIWPSSCKVWASIARSIQVGSRQLGRTVVLILPSMASKSLRSKCSKLFTLMANLSSSMQEINTWATRRVAPFMKKWMGLRATRSTSLPKGFRSRMSSTTMASP